ncbi:ATP-binding protein [Streptomyces sp. Qhu_M48]|uniref:ATP-binding protein n=1 Tax=Streptomyces sp. Qhu_M48 TaxID=3435889 RepID=UPI003F508476
MHVTNTVGERGIRRATTASAPGRLVMDLSDLRTVSLRPVRETLRAHLQMWGLSYFEDRAVLVVTELLTNVLLHARLDSTQCASAKLLMQTEVGGLTLVVSDNLERQPVPGSPGPLDESGRGWALINAFADEVSVSTVPGGKDISITLLRPKTNAQGEAGPVAA